MWRPGLHGRGLGARELLCRPSAPRPPRVHRLRSGALSAGVAPGLGRAASQSAGGLRPRRTLLARSAGPRTARAAPCGARVLPPRTSGADAPARRPPPAQSRRPRLLGLSRLGQILAPPPRFHFPFAARRPLSLPESLKEAMALFRSAAASASRGGSRRPRKEQEDGQGLERRPRLPLPSRGVCPALRTRGPGSAGVPLASPGLCKVPGPALCAGLNPTDLSEFQERCTKLFLLLGLGHQPEQKPFPILSNSGLSRFSKSSLCLCLL